MRFLKFSHRYKLKISKKNKEYWGNQILIYMTMMRGIEAIVVTMIIIILEVVRIIIKKRKMKKRKKINLNIKNLILTIILKKKLKNVNLPLKIQKLIKDNILFQMKNWSNLVKDQRMFKWKIIQGRCILWSHNQCFYWMKWTRQIKIKQFQIRENLNLQFFMIIEGVLQKIKWKMIL